MNPRPDLGRAVVSEGTAVTWQETRVVSAVGELIARHTSVIAGMTQVTSEVRRRPGQVRQDTSETTQVSLACQRGIQGMTPRCPPQSVLSSRR